MDEKQLSLLKMICSRGRNGVLEKYLSQEQKYYLNLLFNQTKEYADPASGRPARKSLIWYEETSEGKRWKASRAGQMMCQEGVTETPLSDSELDLLEELYNHAKARGWKFGKRTEHLHNLEPLDSLKKRSIQFEGKTVGLIFPKKAGAAIYWLPTRAGRAVYEGILDYPTGKKLQKTFEQPGASSLQEINEEIVGEEIVGEEQIGEEPMEEETPHTPPPPPPEIKVIKPGYITFWKDSGTNNIYQNYKEPYLLPSGQQAYAPNWEVGVASVVRGKEKGIITHIIKMSEHPYTIWQNSELTQPFPVLKPDGTVVQAGDASETKVDAVIQALKKKGLSAFKKGPISKKKRNPDEDERTLERQARLGSAWAKRKLDQMRARRGVKQTLTWGQIPDYDEYLEHISAMSISFPIRMSLNAKDSDIMREAIGPGRPFYNHFVLWDAKDAYRIVRGLTDMLDNIKDNIDRASELVNDLDYTLSETDLVSATARMTDIANLDLSNEIRNLERTRDLASSLMDTLDYEWI